MTKNAKLGLALGSAAFFAYLLLRPKTEKSKPSEAAQLAPDVLAAVTPTLF